MSGDRVGTLAHRVAYLRALAILEPDLSPLQVAIIDALEELAEVVDSLKASI